MINTKPNASLYWTCEPCYLTHNGYSAEELGYTPDREPLNLIDPADDVTAGMLREEHDTYCDGTEECGCEEQTFTWSACDGCGSTLGGARYALTVWSA